MKHACYLCIEIIYLDDLLSFLASSGASQRIAAAMDDETSAIEGAMTTALRRVGLYNMTTSFTWLLQYHEEEQLYNETSAAISSGHVSKKKKKKISAAGAIPTSSSSVTAPQLCYHGDMEWLNYTVSIKYLPNLSNIYQSFHCIKLEKVTVCIIQNIVVMVDIGRWRAGVVHSYCIIVF